jgi:hypothetical protein
MFVRKFPRQLFIISIATALILAACGAGGTPAPTQDINAINTAIVGTTVAQFSAQFTQTALAMPQATNTPLPTNTPETLPTFALPTQDTSGALPTVSFDVTPTIAGLASPLPAFTQVASPVPAATQALGDSCFNAVYEADVTYADGTTVKGGETFTKVWKIRNTGTCTWDEGFELVYIGGSPNLGVTNYKFQSKDAVVGGAAIDVPVGVTAPCAAGQYEGHWRMRNDAGYYFGGYFSLYINVTGKTGGC